MEAASIRPFWTYHRGDSGRRKRPVARIRLELVQSLRYKGVGHSRPEELDSNGDPVRTSVGPVLGCVNDATGQEETNSDTELVAGYDSSSDLSGSNFGHVENDDGGDESDTECQRRAQG